MTNSVTFPVALGGDGKTYTDDADPETGLDGLGYTTRLIPLFKNGAAMAGYTAKYAPKIDAAAANADRAEDAKGYVEAVAEAYKVNLLEPLQRGALINMDFELGIYRLDDGVLIETTDFADVGSVSRSTVKYVGSGLLNLREFAINSLARGLEASCSAAVIEAASKNIASPLLAGGDASLTDSGVAFTDYENWQIAHGAVDISSPAGGRSNVKATAYNDVSEDTASTYSLYFCGVVGGANELTVRYYAGESEITETVTVEPSKVSRIKVKAPGSTISFTPAIRIRAYGGDTSILLAGSQLEAKPAASSYIPAPSSAVARAADTVTISNLPQSKTWTLFIDSNGVSIDAIESNRYIISASDGSTSSFLGIFARESSAGERSLRAFVAGTQLVISYFDFTKPFKALIKSDDSVFSFFLNGKKVGTSFSDPDVMSALNQLSIGSVAGGNNVFTLDAKKVVATPYMPTDAFAAAITAI